MEFKPPKNLDVQGANLSENWRKFKQNFEIFMRATDKDKKDSETKVAILLNLVGEDAVELYNTFNLTQEEAKDVKVVMDAFESYCIPKKNVVYERFVFHKRDQKEGEPFEQFLADVKKLSKSCEFECLREQMIRDRIVLGISDLTLQERLLRIDNLDLQKAVDVCRAAELSKAQARNLQERTVVDVLKKKDQGRLKIKEGEKFKCGRECMALVSVQHLVRNVPDVEC